MKSYIKNEIKGKVLIFKPILIASIISLIYFIPASLSGPAISENNAVSSVFTHPNMFLNSNEIAIIKERVNANQQPWKAAYDQLMNVYVPDAMNTPIQSVTFGGIDPPSGDRHDYYSEEPYCGWTRVDGNEPDCRDGQINPNADRTDYTSAMKIGKAVRHLGLAYALTGNAIYADKAIQLIDAWTVDPATKMNPVFTTFSNQSHIELVVTLPAMFYGTDLIWNYPGWNVDNKAALKSWTSDMITSAKTWSNIDNYEDWRLVFISSAAVIAEDSNSLQYSIDRYKAIISDQITAIGEIKYELTRTNSLSYSLSGINGMIQAAEIARHYGEDLYNYKPEGRGLELALDYHAPYVVDPTTWPRQQITPYNGQSAGLYELAYSFKQKSSYNDVINRWGRPMYDTRAIGPVTLTHALIDFNINPTPIPTPTISPIPSPTPSPTPGPTPSPGPNLSLRTNPTVVCYKRSRNSS